MAHLLQKWFSDRVVYVTIAVADTGGLKPVRTLLYKYLEYMLVKFGENHMVLTFLFFFFFFFWLTIFYSADAILEEYLWLKQLFDANL